MPLSTPDLMLQNLRESNTRLEFWIASLASGSTASSDSVRAASPQQMAGLLSELMRAGQCLQKLPEEIQPALQRELDEYRKNVERLRGLLPSMHAVLLGERARLEQERGREESAWARRARETS